MLDGLSANTAPRKLGATTVEEQAWCRWYGRDIYQGNGAVVEWGPWLGSLTQSYCEGLRKNPRITGKKNFAHVYDLFKWSSIFESWSANSPHAGKFNEGDDFREYFCEINRAFEDLLVVKETDLTREKWSGQPIECVINDAVKSLDIGTNVFREWVPCMIPGQSYIAHQDYLWSNNSFIQIFMYLMRESFEFEYAIPNACMVVFKNIKQCDPRTLSRLGADSNTLARELIEETFAWSEKVLEGVDAQWIALCKSATLRDFGHCEAAQRTAVDYQLNKKTGDPTVDFQLDVLRSWGYSDMLGEPEN